MRVLPIQIPLVAAEGKGSRLWDVDGREYIDLNSAYGPLLLGHRHPRIVAAVTQQIENSGSLLGFPTEITVRVAEKVKRLYPSIELLRFANSGTEATLSMSSMPSLTSMPITACVMLLAMLHEISVVVASVSAPYCSATSRPRCTATVANVVPSSGGVSRSSRSAVASAVIVL